MQIFRSDSSKIARGIQDSGTNIRKHPHFHSSNGRSGAAGVFRALAAKIAASARTSCPTLDCPSNRSAELTVALIDFGGTH